MFTEADLTEALDRAGSEVGKKVSAYLIGGAAMAFMGRKMATKDIDIVFGSLDDSKVFVSAMQHVGFASLRKLRGGITHLTSGEVQSEYCYYGGYYGSTTNCDGQVSRSLFIGEVLYTLSPTMMKMNGVADLSEIKAVSF